MNLKLATSILLISIFCSVCFSVNTEGVRCREEAGVFDENGTQILLVRYFDYIDIRDSGALDDYITGRREVIGFLEVIKTDEEYFRNLNRDFFKFYYYYSSIDGQIRSDFKNERKEVNFKYITYRQNGVDFGGKRDCGDCGSPLSSGYGEGYFDGNAFGIENDNIIYMVNYAVDRSKPHSLSLSFEFEGQFVDFAMDVK